MKKGSKFTEDDLRKMGLVEKNGMYVKKAKIETSYHRKQSGEIHSISYVPHPLLDGFFECCLKISPLPNSRPRLGKSGAYNTSTYTAYKKSLIILMMEQKIPHDDWRSLECTFHYAFTKGMKKGERYEGKPRRVRPDVDNLGKAIMDALQYASVIKDDGQLWDVQFKKVYTHGDPYIHIKLKK